MPRLPTECPACSSGLEVSRLTCPSCAMQLEGRFELPPLLRLSRDDLEFVTAFVRSSGSLKEMGAQLGQSYPTVRNRLNEILERLAMVDEDRDRRRRRILDALAHGEIGVKEATRRLKEIEP